MSSGLYIIIRIKCKWHRDNNNSNVTTTNIATYPNITACHLRISFSWGAPLIPAGGSVCRRLKSLISLLLAGVDMLEVVCLFCSGSCALRKGIMWCGCHSVHLFRLEFFVARIPLKGASSRQNCSVWRGRFIFGTSISVRYRRTLTASLRKR